MPSLTYTIYSASAPHCTPDRDGYDHVAYSVGILLRLYNNGRVECLQSEGGISNVKQDISESCQLAGHWSDNGDGFITLTLVQEKPFEDIELEVPGDGSEFYAYPSSGTAAFLYPGTYQFISTRSHLYFPTLNCPQPEHCRQLCFTMETETKPPIHEIPCQKEPVDISVFQARLSAQEVGKREIDAKEEENEPLPEEESFPDTSAEDYRKNPTVMFISSVVIWAFIIWLMIKIF